LLIGPVVIAVAQKDNGATQFFAPTGGVGAADGVMWLGRTGTGACTTVSLCNHASGSPCHCWEIVGDSNRAVLENSTSDTVAGLQLSVGPLDHSARRLLADPIASGDSQLPPDRAFAERFVGALRAGSACRPDFAFDTRGQRLIADIEALTQAGQSATREAV
jgi:predicted dehydrogenase